MNTLALQLIAENKVSKNPFLDLGRCGLKRLPDELGELVWLETLVLADRAALWDGTNLKPYYHNNGGGTNETLNDLAAVSRLPKLQALYANGTQIADLSAIATLNSLQYLNISHTEITDLAPITAFSNLKYLYGSTTKIKDLAPVANLSNLQYLDVSYTKVADLSPIALLRKLKH